MGQFLPGAPVIRNPSWNPNLNHGSQRFTAAGVWVCPPGVTRAWLTGRAGGGGQAGAGGATSFGSLLTLGGGSNTGAGGTGPLPGTSGTFSPILDGFGAVIGTQGFGGGNASASGSAGANSGAGASFTAGVGVLQPGCGQGGGCIRYAVNVVPGAAYSVTIGAGGTGGNTGGSGYLDVEW